MKHLLVALFLLSSLALPALDHTKDYQANVQAAVRIVTDKGAAGSGLAVGKRHILTAGHVCEDEDGVRVDFVSPDGKVVAVRGKVEKMEQEDPFNKDLGLIVLSEDAPYWVPLKLGEDKIGDEGYTVGAPKALLPRNVVVGIFGGSHEHLDLRTLSGPNAPGASGSAVFNDKHELVGILVSGEPALLVYFIPVSDIKEFLKDVKFKVRK